MVLVSGIWHNDLIFIYSGMIITNLVTCVIQSCIFFMMRAFKIYSISNFKICNTVLLTIVILPYVPPPQYLFYILEFVPFDPIHLFHFHPSSLPLATTNLFYLWAWLKNIYIYTPHGVEYLYGICLCLTYFTQHNDLKVHPYCSKWQCFTLFKGWIVIQLNS